ncbi:MAG: hypothetical protein WBG54_17320 [Acidobacteriaceae bacterium]
MPRLPESARFWVLLVCIDLTVPAVILWKVRAGEIDHAVALSSCWVSFILANAIFWWGMHRSDRRTGRSASGARIIPASALALVAALATTLAVNAYAARNSYMALATSNRPLTSIHPARRRIVVELLRARIASSKQYQSELAHVAPISPPLYSPQSFASTNAMNETVRQLQGDFELDAGYFGAVQQSYTRFREQMQQADPEYLRSWISNPGNVDEANLAVFSLEKQWFQSVNDLYGYAELHHKDISLRNEDLAFSSPDVKAGFEKLKSTSEDLHQKLLREQTALMKQHQQANAELHN